MDKMVQHPYIKYALALVMLDNNLTRPKEITVEMLKDEILRGLNHFSLMPADDFVGKSDIIFKYCEEKNDAKSFHFLAPNAISSAMNAVKLYNAALNATKTQIKDLKSSTKLTQSEMPLAGEFCTFSPSGVVGRGKPSSTVFEELLSLIVTLTIDKPCLNTMGNTGIGENVCLIPDISIQEDLDFIKLFRRLMSQRLSSDSLTGKVKLEGKTGREVYTPKRPMIYFGNFPDAPRSTALSSIALLGSIGELTKDAEVSLLASRVLESLKNRNIYTIGYGTATAFRFNNYIIELSQKGRLRSIVDSIFWCNLYSVGQRSFKEKSNVVEYQKFDLFASRFLQLFNKPAFQDFLSFRAEYPKQMRLLLETYFEKMENINHVTVHSALEMGKWLNKAAFVAACRELESKGEEQTPEKVTQLKSKTLVELESSIMSAKTGDALLSQVIVRVGRLTGMDVPTDATVFMEKTASGELKLEQAKNLLMAFARVRDMKGLRNSVKQTDDIGENEINEDNSEL